MSWTGRATASAARLVQHFGEGVTITFTKVGGTINDETRALTASPTTMTLKCSRPGPFSRKLIDGQRILEDDVRVLVSKQGPARTFELVPDLLATVRGRTYRVVDVRDLSGADVLQLRGNPA